MLAAPVLLVGCFWTTTTDRAPTMTHRGVVYTRILAPTAVIQTEDLREVGEADSIDDPDAVEGTTVYSLDGVAQDTLVVMHAADGESGDYLMFWHPDESAIPSDRISDETGLADWVKSVPGLCVYFEEVPCPGESPG